MAMKVLLWQTIDKLGKRGDQVNVAEGYARNFLFPRRLATPATSGQAREFKAAARKAEKVEASMKSQFSQLAAQVSGAHVTIEMLANAEGVLFGSVSPSMVVEALKRENIIVDARYIIIDTPIKSLGDFSVTARFHPEVQGKLKVTVTPSKAEAVKEEGDEENPFTKGISVDEAERSDPRNRGKRPKKPREGDKGKEGAKKEGAEGAAKAEGAKSAGAKSEAPKAEAPKAEKPEKSEKPAKAEKAEKSEKK